MNRFFRSALFPLIIIAALVWLALQTLGAHGTKTTPATLYQVLTKIKTDPASIDHAVFVPSKQELDVFETEGAGGKKIVVHYAGDQSQAQIQDLLLNHSVNFDSKGVGSNPWWSILTSLLPFVLLFGFWIFLMNQVQGGGSKVMSFGKSRAKRMTPDSPKIGFKDVAGVDEAVEELGEIKEFLENPKKFQALGARIPTGVLLYGPPGTGKSKLARALATTAGAIFYHVKLLNLTSKFGANTGELLQEILRIAGGAHGFLYPGLAALVTDDTPEERRASVVGLFSAMFLVGNTAGAFFFGWVAHVAGYAVMWSALTVLLTIGGALSTRLARPPSR